MPEASVFSIKIVGRPLELQYTLWIATSPDSGTPYRSVSCIPRLANTFGLRFRHTLFLAQQGFFESKDTDIQNRTKPDPQCI